MQYLYLAIAIVAEVIGTSTLKATHSFTRLVPSLVVAGCYTTSFLLLSELVKSMPVGVVYAVWSGAGIVLVTIVAAIWLKQPLDFPALVGIAFIVVGVLIVNLFSKSVVH